MHLEADLGPFSHGVLLLKDPESAEDDMRADAPAQAMVQLVELWLQVKSRQILCMRIAGEPSQGTEGRPPCRPQLLDFNIGANDGVSALDIHSDVPNGAESPKRCANHLGFKICILLHLENIQKPHADDMCVEGFALGYRICMLGLRQRKLINCELLLGTLDA